MKFLKTLLLFCILSNVAQAQKIPSNCAGSEQLYNTYYRDVQEMAAVYINHQKVPDTLQVTPPQLYMDTVFAALSAVYNMKNAQADTLFNSYCVHSENAYKQMLMDVYVDGSLWTNNWENRQITTGITNLDNLLAKYNFSVYKFSNGAGYRWATLITDSVINMYALADTLKKFSGIVDASAGQWPSLMIADRTYLSFTRDTVSYLSFILNWGHYKQYSQTWNYKIDNNCDVTLLSTIKRTYDQPDLYATPLYCNAFPLSVNSVKNNSLQLYPNPAGDQIAISGIQTVARIVVTDMYGKMFADRSIQNGAQINISTLSPGVYMATVTEGIHKETVKLIKL